MIEGQNIGKMLFSRKTAEFILKKYYRERYIHQENLKFYGSALYHHNLKLDHSARYSRTQQNWMVSFFDTYTDLRNKRNKALFGFFPEGVVQGQNIATPLPR